MRHTVALCQQIALTIYTQVWIKVVTKISDFIRTEPKHTVWTGHHVRLANGIHEVANKPFEILLTNFFAVQKNHEKKWILATLQGVHLAVTDTKVGKRCEYLNVVVDQTTTANYTTAPNQSHWPKFAAPDEEVPHPTPTNLEYLLSLPFKTKHGPDSRQQHARVGSVVS